MDELIMRGFGNSDLGGGGKSVSKSCQFSMKLKPCSSKEGGGGGTQLTAGEIVGSIDDLLTLILLCLPAKSLVRFQLVSRHWRSLINNSQFRSMFNAKHKSTPAGFFFCFKPYRVRSCDVQRVDYLPLFPNVNNIQPDWGGLIIRQSCNGLLLGTTDKKGLEWHEGGRRVRSWFVCNPTTRQVAAIPDAEYHGLNIGVQITLCFDPAKSPYYKIVSLMCTTPREDPRMIFQLRIYSSETGLWSSGVQDERFVYASYGDGVYWNGVVHWIGNANSIYLSIEDGEIGTFRSPPNACFHCQVNLQRYVGVCCDQLSYVSFNGMWQVDIYGLKRDRSEWFVNYRVDLSSLCHIYPDINKGNPFRLYCADHSADIEDKSFKAHCVVHGAEEKDSFLVFEAARRVIRWDLVSNTFQELFKLEETLTTSNGCLYMESLCSV